MGIDFRPISFGVPDGTEHISPAPGPAEQSYRELYAKLNREGLSLWAIVLSELTRENPDLIIIDSCLYTPKMVKALEPLQYLCIRLSVILPDDRQAVTVSPVPELVLCPRELGLPDLTPVPHERYFVEPSIFLGRPRPLFPAIDPDKPLVYCSLGTQSLSYEQRAHTLEKVFDCLGARDNLQVLTSIGSNESRADFPPPPPNMILLEGVSQLTALEHASLFLTHGGLGSIKEAILARVPMIALPFSHDQPLNAVRISHHGLGNSLTGHDWSVTDLDALISSVLYDPDIRSRLSRFYQIFYSAEQESPSIAHIERFLDGRRTSKKQG